MPLQCGSECGLSVDAANAPWMCGVSGTPCVAIWSHAWALVCVRVSVCRMVLVHEARACMAGLLLHHILM